jgi:hypothetical protein
MYGNCPDCGKSVRLDVNEKQREITFDRWQDSLRCWVIGPHVKPGSMNECSGEGKAPSGLMP